MISVAVIDFFYVKMLISITQFYLQVEQQNIIIIA